MSAARIAVFRGPGRPFDLEDRPLPKHLGPREILVRLRLATICGSDLHTLAGRRDEPTPSVLGHEGVGEVVALGAGRSECAVGDRITWTLADSCGHCAACEEWDLPQKCRRLFKYGHAPLSDGTGLNGCYATHLLLRSGTAVVVVPPKLPDTLVASANCSLATMVNAVEIGSSRLPRTAAVQGGGLLGLHGALLLRARGTPTVVLFDIDPTRLDLARAFGIDARPASDAAALPEASFDAVIEAAGSSSVLRDGLRLLRPGGTYTWVGMVHPNTPLDLTGEAILRKCARIHGVHNYAPNHLRRAVAFLEAHHDQFPWDRLVSPALPLARLNQAMEQARTGRWLRVAVDPTQP